MENQTPTEIATKQVQEHEADNKSAKPAQPLQNMQEEQNSVTDTNMSEAIDGLQVTDKSTKEIDVVMQEKSESGKNNQN